MVIVISLVEIQHFEGIDITVQNLWAAEWIIYFMGRKLISPDETESKTGAALHKFAQRDHAGSEQLMLELIREARDDAHRYFPYLYYGEILMKMGMVEDSRDFLARSAQIALNQKNHLWLVLSHEKLGDLSAAEENWFGAHHHYRYALRKATSFIDRLAMEKLEAKINVVQGMLQATVLSRDANIIPLSKEYVSGPMAISFVQRDIFLKKFFARCLQCNFCHDACCSYGADIDIQNVEKIQQQKEEILPFIRPSEAGWFEAESTYYEEYVGSQYTRINTQGPRCVFISKD